MGQVEDRITRIPRSVGAWIAMFLAGSGLLFAAWWLLAHGPEQRRMTRADIRERAEAIRRQPPEPVPQLYKPLTRDDALAENATLPFSTAPIERAPPLVVPLSASTFVDRRSALDCLTAAIYYEAGQESDQGKRAVAQVVLTRARHPACPSSLCGVVYQGSERRTGCQFTFTCDGSLARKPSRAGWDAARRVAVAALSGSVELSVGMATHYHADYVVPYWASSLAKIAKIDRHIFYRWQGGWGRRAAFSQSVSQEQVPGDQPQIANIADLEASGAAVPTADLPAASSRILADAAGGKPLAGGDALPGDPARPGPAIKADALSTRPAADSARGDLKAN